MSPDSQKLEWLRFHAGLRADAPAPPSLASPRVTDQFRPYTGKLDTGSILHVSAIAEELELAADRDPNLRVPTALALWVLTNIIERWVLDNGGMLQRNKLIEKTDTDRVREWVSELHDLGCRLLEGHPDMKR